MPEAKQDKKKEERIKQLQDKEYQKRKKREEDIKRESKDGFEKKIAGD